MGVYPSNGPTRFAKVGNAYMLVGWGKGIGVLCLRQRPLEKEEDHRTMRSIICLCLKGIRLLADYLFLFLCLGAFEATGSQKRHAANCPSCVYSHQRLCQPAAGAAAGPDRSR